jgi:hypothetical protein
MAEGVRSDGVDLSIDQLLAKVRVRVEEMRHKGLRWLDGEKVHPLRLANRLEDTACEMPELNPQSPEVIRLAVETAAHALYLALGDPDDDEKTT